MNESIVLSNIYNNSLPVTQLTTVDISAEFQSYRWYTNVRKTNTKNRQKDVIYKQSDFIDVREHTIIINIRQRPNIAKELELWHNRGCWARS